MEHVINGKKFFKKGGRYYPAYQEGGDVTEDFGNAFSGYKSKFKEIFPKMNLEPANKWYNSPSTWGTIADVGAVTLNSLANKPNPGTSARASAMGKSYTDDKQAANIGAGILGTAAMMDPTGTAKLIDTGVKLGRAAKNVINPGDEYGVSRSNAAEVTGNILDPLGRFQQSINIGKKHGFGEGVKDLMTFGVSGNNLMKDAVQKAEYKDKLDDMRMRQGMNQGSYRNDSVYAQRGAHIKPKSAYEEPNVEIESGEIVLADPRNIQIHGNATTANESKYAAEFVGDKHGQDSDGDGKEGIPLTSGEAYVASDYLGVNGKKSGPGNKSVAAEMRPMTKFLHNAEIDDTDPYKNNPIAIKEMNRQMHNIKKEAERNKFMEELSKLTKKKDRNLNEVLEFMTTQAPMEDMTPEEQEMINQSANQLNNQINNQQQNEMYNTKLNRAIMAFGGHYMQQGGMTQPEQNPSSDRMNQLVQESPALAAPEQGQGQGGQLSPEAQQMLQQLPPEVQQQIMALPAQEQEAAIMEYAQQAGAGQPAQAPEGMGMAAGAPEQGGMPAEGAEVGTDASGQPIMKCGGKMYRRGDYIKFKHGGRVHEGRISNINSSTGGFSLD